MLRLRSDEQLVALFRAGHEEAFRTIHDRYRVRLFAYTRQMLAGSRPDAEDALQDIFVRAYAGLRANDRELTLRAWLYRIAHNRCVDELRRPAPPPPEALGLVRAPVHDPVVEAERRESLRRLIEDVRRLPEQQRSALLMRELGGMPYSDVAGALGVSIPAVKSLLVRARVGLAQALEARDTACEEIREELIVAHDRGVRPGGLARRHMHDCAGCRAFRTEIRGVSRQFAGLVAPIGPLGVLANMLGIGGGASGGAAAASGGATGAAGAAAATGAAGSGVAGGAGILAVSHVATLLAAAVVTAGGAVGLQHALGSAPAKHHRHAHRATASAPASTGSSISTSPTAVTPDASGYQSTAAPALTAVPHGAAGATSTSTSNRQSSGRTSTKRVTGTQTKPVTGGTGVGGNPSGDGAAGLPGSVETTPISTDPSSTSSTTGTTTVGTGDGTGSGSGPAVGTTTGTPSGSPTSTGSGGGAASSSTSDPTATTSSAGSGSSGSSTSSGSSGTSSGSTGGSGWSL